MTEPFFTDQTPVTDEALNIIAHLPTRSLTSVAANGFFKKMTDADFMRLAVLLAQKGYEEGGCPIGGVIISNETRQVLGKGHNTLVQENHPYNHGETSAIRDAGRRDFSLTTIFTTLSPCDICAALICDYLAFVSMLGINALTDALLAAGFTGVQEIRPIDLSQHDRAVVRGIIKTKAMSINNGALAQIVFEAVDLKREAEAMLEYSLRPDTTPAIGVLTLKNERATWR